MRGADETGVVDVDGADVVDAALDGSPDADRPPQPIAHAVAAIMSAAVVLGCRMVTC
jgi:hypothetical protein